MKCVIQNCVLKDHLSMMSNGVALLFLVALRVQTIFIQSLNFKLFLHSKKVRF
ncbi:hypothetical protein BPO_1340 [Bergeyella porcorum]|uniref:Uncharacterized protein n=1 Tax=Bergeyella porcorum TaxID=1735111 RepID=A0AAU0F300_9FLAO